MSGSTPAYWPTPRSDLVVVRSQSPRWGLGRSGVGEHADELDPCAHPEARVQPSEGVLDRPRAEMQRCADILVRPTLGDESLRVVRHRRGRASAGGATSPPGRDPRRAAAPLRFSANPPRLRARRASPTRPPRPARPPPRDHRAARRPRRDGPEGAGRSTAGGEGRGDALVRPEPPTRRSGVVDGPAPQRMTEGEGAAAAAARAASNRSPATAAPSRSARDAGGIRAVSRRTAARTFGGRSSCCPVRTARAARVPGP